MELANNLLKAGQVVYICDYRFIDINNKPIRHVKPTKVMVVDNSELPKNKTVYYSETHFRPFTKTGKVSNKIIAPFDNTGYRYRTGGCVNIYDNMEECIEKYNKQCELAINELNVGKTNAIDRFDGLIKDVKNNMI